MNSEVYRLVNYVLGSLLTCACILTPIVLFFVAYIRNKRAEHEMRMRLLESNSSPELIKALIESKQKTAPKLVLLRIGLPAIFASIFGGSFVYAMNYFYKDSGFEGALIAFICVIILGTGIGLVSALFIERKLLKKAEETK